MSIEDKAKAFDIIAKNFHLDFHFEEKDENGEVVEAFLFIEDNESYEEGAWDVTASAVIKGEDLKILRGVIK